MVFQVEEKPSEMDTITTDFENWGPYLMKQFQQMYDKGERCDLEISCNKKIFLVHRLILSTCSEYVRDLGDKQHIILPDEVSCKALKSIIDFVYTGKIIFCKDEKDDILLASNLLHMRLLTELIKMEESCSFTLSMDDENEESKSNENTNDNLNLDLSESTDLISDEKSSEPAAATQTVKKKEVKSGRPRGNKNTVLPPLFKFPFLHQKFSSSRTYGLITILTDLVPSRLEIPDSILQSCPFQSSFEDVTYETGALCSYESMDAPLQPVHEQFLKKLRETPQRRSFASALFSPFDKYTPPYNTSSEMHTPKKRESVTSSYLAAVEAPAAKKPALKTSQTPKKSVTFAKELEVIVECPPRSYSDPSASPRPSHSSLKPPAPVYKPVVEPPETTAAIDVALESATSDIDMELPAPLSPVANISDDLMDASFDGSGERVELTNLRNVAMPMEVEELCHPTVIEYRPRSSAASRSPIATNGLDESTPAVKKLPNCEDITMTDTIQVDLMQNDISMANEGETLSSGNSEATTLAPLAVEKTKVVEVEPRNPAAEERPEVVVIETTETAAAEKDETEVEILPVVERIIITREERDVCIIPDSHNDVVTSKETSEKSSSAVHIAVKATPRKQPAKINVTKAIPLAPVVPPASTVKWPNLSNVDNIFDLSGDELSCDEDDPAPIGPQVEPVQQPVPISSTETTPAEAVTTTVAVSAGDTNSSSSSTSASVIPATESEVVLTNSEPIILPNIIEKPAEDDSTLRPSTSSNTTATKPNLQDSCKKPEEVILSDSTVFTAIDKKSVSQISTDPNSQIFALKVKGTENPTQLSQLVDLCKKNPLFKNKNVKFKIVPVKGSISKTLQEHTQLSNNLLNKAIIVQRTTPAKGSNAREEVASVAKSTTTVITSPSTKSSITKVSPSPASLRVARIPLVENVAGPWECSICKDKTTATPLKLSSYFEYRTHLHKVHNEPNNPIYCQHCGHKALKRNQQLYHLLTKHQIEPPPNVQFPKCDRCEFVGLNEYFLQKHQASHQSTGMEYVCSCKMPFKTSELLQQHIASNSCKNSSSFSCGYCNTQFSRFVNLKAHMRVCMKERSKPAPQSAPAVESAKPQADEPAKSQAEEPEAILP